MWQLATSYSCLYASAYNNITPHSGFDIHSHTVLSTQSRIFHAFPFLLVFRCVSFQCNFVCFPSVREYLALIVVFAFCSARNSLYLFRSILSFSFYSDWGMNFAQHLFRAGKEKFYTFRLLFA